MSDDYKLPPLPGTKKSQDLVPWNEALDVDLPLPDKETARARISSGGDWEPGSYYKEVDWLKDSHDDWDDAILWED